MIQCYILKYLNKRLFSERLGMGNKTDDKLYLDFLIFVSFSELTNSESFLETNHCATSFFLFVLGPYLVTSALTAGSPLWAYTELCLKDHMRGWGSKKDHACYIQGKCPTHCSLWSRCHILRHLFVESS